MEHPDEKLLVLAVALLASVAFVAAGSEDMTFVGRVADATRAKDFANAGHAEHKGCATGCLSRGGGVALASPLPRGLDRGHLDGVGRFGEGARHR